MKRVFALLLAALLCLGLGFVVACGGGDDDDDDSADDDVTDDDVSDDDAADDDAADDDAADDDATDDDATDDDAADDDATDDDATDDDSADDDTEEGTWTDSESGLMWPTKAPGGGQDWDSAIDYCDALTYADFDDWRLPTISELRTLVRGCASTEGDGSCGVTDECTELTCYDDTCYVCNEDEGPNNGCYGPTELPGECNWFWSSSDMAGSTSDLAWGINFSTGDVAFDSMLNPARSVRCVRDAK